MARVFAQDAWKKCQEQGIDGRYEMILLAAHRAKQYHKGKSTIIPYDTLRGKSPGVNALRDFETGEVDMDELREDLIQSMQQVREPSTQEEE